MGLKISYVGLTMITLVFIIIIGFKAINNSSSSTTRDKLILVFGLLIWQGFIWGLSSTDILKSYDFPPRFALAFIVPSFIFTGLFLFRSRKRKWINEIPEHWIIYFQSFRIIVETIFVYSVSAGILNHHVTIEGYNFDMIVGITAPVLALLVYHLKVLPRKVVLVWNFMGLAVLASVIFLFITAIYKPELYGSSEPLLPLDAFVYPYVLVAGFLMPVAVFLHVLSILQFRKSN
ncbi:MAG: hypothetical protein ACI9J3_000297 [Parvicellaceae bacterium]|jgi:hypothetical protein